MVTCQDGSKKIINFKPATLGSGEQLVFYEDVTEAKKMEENLRQAQKMESVGTLAGGIAHDFNNILSSILGYTELAINDVEKDTALEDYLYEVYSAGNRATDLVKQILAYARQSEGALKPIQVNPIVKEVLKFMRSSIPTTIEIRQTVDSNSLIMGNPTQIHQILMNLCTNSAFALEDTGGILEVGLKDVFIDSTSPMCQVGLKKGEYIEIKVADTGTGIPPDIIDSIFEPYFTTKGIGEGTGMGLSMVHGIVESYGGKISVKSALGEGTTFTIYLPITKKLKTYRKDRVSQEAPTGSESVLIIDDEDAIAKLTGQVLEQLGYSVTTRSSSVEALELFRSKPNDFDLIITDMTMPNMTGDELAVEAMKVRPDIPVILCTGYSRKISDEKASEIGVKALAYKPVLKSDLATIVRKVLDEKQNGKSSGCILLIDDEYQFCQLFVQKLAGSRFEIILASDGKEGIKIYREKLPDLVITDLIMPEKEGIETIIELKKEFPDVKIIAISGGGHCGPQGYLEIAERLGVERTFSKPIDWQELTKTMKALLA